MTNFRKYSLILLLNIATAAVTVASTIMSVSPLVTEPTQVDADCSTAVYDGLVALQWRLDSDFVPAYFEVQRYQTGTKFETIASLAAVDEGILSYLDHDAVGVAYYRLRYIGAKGQQKFSSTSRVVVHADVDVVINTDDPSAPTIDISVQGKYEIARVISASDGTVMLSTTISSDPTSLSLAHCPQGTYILELRDINGSRKLVKKVVKV